MDAATQARLARQTADQVLAEFAKLGDPKWQAIALDYFVSALGPRAPEIVKGWSAEGGDALRTGLAMAITKYMEAQGIQAQESLGDVGAGFAALLGGGATGGANGKGAASGGSTWSQFQSGVETGVNVLNSALGFGVTLANTMQNLRNQGSTTNQVQQELNALKSQVAAQQAQQAATRATGLAITGGIAAPSYVPLYTPSATRQASDVQTMQQPPPAPPPPAEDNKILGMAPKTAAIVGGSAAGLGLLALVLSKVL